MDPPRLSGCPRWDPPMLASAPGSGATFAVEVPVEFKGKELEPLMS